MLAISMVIMVGKILDPSADILIHWGHGAAYLLALLSGAMMLLCVLPMLWLFRQPDKSLFDHLFEQFGNVIGSIVGLLLLLALLIDICTTLRLDVHQIEVAFLPTTSPILIVMIYVAAMSLPVYFGIEGLGRSNLIMFVLLFITLISLLLFMLTRAHLSYMPPVLGPGLPNLLQQGVLHLGFFAEMLLFFIFRPYLRTYREFRWSFLTGYIASVLWIALALFVFNLVIPYPTSDHLMYPFLESAKIVYFGRFIQHIEAVYAVAWVASSLIRLNIFIFAASLLCAELLRTANYRRFIAVVGAISFYGSLIPPSIMSDLSFKDIVSMQRSFLLYVSIPLALGLVAYIRKWRQKRNGKTGQALQNQA